MTTAAPFETDKLIRFHHCDPAGIVFYPQYFVLFNELVEDWFNGGLGMDFGNFHAVDRLGVPMAHIECDFLVALEGRRGAPVPPRGEEDRHQLAHAGRRRARRTDEVRVRATLVVVLASLDAHRPVPFPPEFREKLARFQTLARRIAKRRR